MRKNPRAGTGPYNDRQDILKSARQRRPREERRVTCKTCNGAGEVFIYKTTQDRITCRACNGSGQVTA